MAEAHTFSCLFKRILMPMNLGEDGTELHLQARDDHKFTHAVADGAFLKVEVVHTEIVEGLVDAASTFL